MATQLYSEVRDKIRTGDLLIWRVKRIKSLSTLILYLYQKIWKRRSSHVGIAANIEGRLFVIEAKTPYVRMYPLSMKPDFMVVHTNIEKWEIALDALFIHIGKPYTLLDLIEGLLGWQTTERKLYCSELCAVFYNDIGYLPIDPESEELPGKYPDRLVDIVEQRSGNKAYYVHVDKGNLKSI